jgi:hypothetical protein
MNAIYCALMISTDFIATIEFPTFIKIRNQDIDMMAFFALEPFCLIFKSFSNPIINKQTNSHIRKFQNLYLLD